MWVGRFRQQQRHVAVRSPATLMVVVLLHFCSPIPLLNALAPRDGITRTRDIAYASGPRHTLDVYAPRAAATPAPVIVFFYGGGWTSGSKETYRFVGRRPGRTRRAGRDPRLSVVSGGSLPRIR